MGRVTAVFTDRTQAEQAVEELRRMGVTNEHLSFVGRHDEDQIAETAGEDVKETAKDTGVGALAGAGVGAIFGIGAALIPGVGPFIAAATVGSLGAYGAGFSAAALGASATSLLAATGAGLAGAAAGGAVGGIAGALAKVGYEQEEAEFYGQEIERGGLLIAVDTDEISDEQALALLDHHGGRMWSRAS